MERARRCHMAPYRRRGAPVLALDKALGMTWYVALTIPDVPRRAQQNQGEGAESSRWWTKNSRYGTDEHGGFACGQSPSGEACVGHRSTLCLGHNRSKVTRAPTGFPVVQRTQSWLRSTAKMGPRDGRIRSVEKRHAGSEGRRSTESARLIRFPAAFRVTRAGKTFSIRAKDFPGMGWKAPPSCAGVPRLGRLRFTEVLRRS